MIRRLIAAVSVMAAFGLSAATVGETVVVVYNLSLPESRAVAEHYVKARQIPASSLLGLELPKDEIISRAEYRERLEKPLLNWMMANGGWEYPAEAGQGKLPKKARIRYAVLCYGVPLKIAADPSLKEEEASKQVQPELRRNEAAVDSELACLPLAWAGYPAVGVITNHLYGNTNQLSFSPTNGLLLVGRLDGPSPEIAKGLVDRALEAEANGLWGRAYFDMRGTTNRGYILGDIWIGGAAFICGQLGFETTTDTNEATFPISFPMSDIAVYAGWYSENVCGPFARSPVDFRPGAIAYHLHSFSAATLRSTNRHWAGPLLAAGVTATLGCVNEPYLEGTPDVARFIGLLLDRGFTFGEAAWAAQKGLSWQTTVIGDPLYRPAAMPPEQRHRDLELKQNRLIEWSHLKLVNINLARGRPAAEWISYLEGLPETRRSAVLTEKLADLYWAAKKYSDALYTTEEALKRGCTPRQRERLMLIWDERLEALGRDQKRFDLLERFVTECPAYPAMQNIYRRLADVATRLGRQDAVEKYTSLAEGKNPAKP